MSRPIPARTPWPLTLLAGLLAGCVSMTSSHPDALLEEAHALLASGRAAKAVRLAARVRNAFPELHRATLLWAYAAKEIALATKPQDFRLLDRVEQACLELARSGAAGVEAWFALGLVRRDRGDLGGAALAWEIALEQEPLHPGSLRSLAALEYGRRRPRAAAQLYARLLTVPPPAAEVHYRLGVCALADVLLRRDLAPVDFDPVEAHFQEARRLDPEHAEALRGLAWIVIQRSRIRGRWAISELRQEDATAAKALLQTALAATPAHPHCNHDLGWILAELGREQEAEVLFLLALTTDPDHGPALVDYALLRERRGAPAAEVAALRRRALERVEDPSLARALQMSLQQSEP